MFRKSKSYIAVLLGGYPANTDKIMELIADPHKHLSFIYGFGVFVLYFSSKKPLSIIEQTFNTTLKTEVEMMFIFPNNKKAIKYITPRLQNKIDVADTHRKNIINNDLSVLKEILFMLGSKYNWNAPPIPYIVDTESNSEQPLTDKEIIDQLLVKINQSGYESLTKAEQDFLRDYKSKHSKDDQNNQADVD